MSKCCVKGCKKKGNIDFQTKRWSKNGQIQSYMLCYGHGHFMKTKELEFEIEREEGMTASVDSPVKKNYAQTAKLKTYSGKVQETIVSNKDTLTLSNYSTVTGKRFRMTKEQKARDISRETAFQEFMNNV